MRGWRHNEGLAVPRALLHNVTLQGLPPPTTSRLGNRPGACLGWHLDRRVAGQAKPVLHHLALQAGRKGRQAGRQQGMCDATGKPQRLSNACT